MEKANPSAAAQDKQLAKKVSKGGSGFVALLGKTTRVLEAFSATDVWLGTTELSLRAEIPKPTASRIAKSLSSLGHLHYSPTRRKYRLGLGVLSLGFAARTEAGIVNLIKPQLQALANEFGVHASLATRDQTDIIQLEVAHSTNTLMTLRLNAGSRIPIAGTASGHAYLAALGEDERAQLMKRLNKRHAKHWDALSAQIETGVKQALASGYTVSQRGWQTDINGVAAPVRVPGGRPYVLTCGAPARHLSQKKMIEIGARLTKLACSIADQIVGVKTVASVTPKRLA